MRTPFSLNLSCLRSCIHWSTEKDKSQSPTDSRNAGLGCEPLPVLIRDWRHCCPKDTPPQLPNSPIPGGQAKLCRLLSGIVALPRQALLRLALLEKRTRGHQRRRKEKGLSKSSGPTQGLPKVQGETTKAHTRPGRGPTHRRLVGWFFRQVLITSLPRSILRLR